MNLKTLNKKLLYDDDLVMVANLSESEMEMLTWLRDAVKKEGVEKIDLTLPNISANVIKSVMYKLEQVHNNKENFYGFSIVRQLGKEGFYIANSKGKIIKRIQNVDDRI